MKKYIKKVIPLILTFVLILSLSCVAFAVDDTKTATHGTNTLTGTLTYYGKNDAGAGELDMFSKWDGSAVRGIYATAEAVDYLTGKSLKIIQNSLLNSTGTCDAFGWTDFTQKVTIYGCGEIRDSFNLVVYPTIYGTYGLN
ncbi:MAG TPA: hypothetical protein DGZ34_09115 [Lachnospiraceae bacterium]|nr:hypothetical protein [Lachnospiraceae bacterium]